MQDALQVSDTFAHQVASYDDDVYLPSLFGRDAHVRYWFPFPVGVNPFFSNGFVLPSGATGALIKFVNAMAQHRCPPVLLPVVGAQFAAHTRSEFLQQ